MIFAIDPGTTLSAYVTLDENLKPLHFGKIPNEELLDILKIWKPLKQDHLVIESIASYGARVGETTFETVFWTGRFYEVCTCENKARIKRQAVKKNLCNLMKAKDTDIRRALIKRFAKFDLINGKGKKESPDWFFGVSNDVWSAIAVGVTFSDTYLNKHT